MLIQEAYLIVKRIGTLKVIYRALTTVREVAGQELGKLPRMSTEELGVICAYTSKKRRKHMRFDEARSFSGAAHLMSTYRRQNRRAAF